MGQGAVDDWAGALGYIREKLIKLDEYVDEHNLYGDLTHINDKYTPALMRDEVAAALKTLDEQLSYWAGKGTDKPAVAEDDQAGPVTETPAAAASQRKGR